MKQRLGVALAIMGKPGFLILDEPVNGLDPTGIVEFRDMIKSLNKEYGVTILISSHILSELEQVADRYGIIHKGRLVKEFTQEKLREDTKKCLSVKVSDTAGAAAVLEQKLGIREYEVLPGNELRLYAYLDNPSEVAFQLATNQIKVESLTEVGNTLESYYLNAINQN
jgi:ABC-2 type transport system ATP-binding protein